MNKKILIGLMVLMLGKTVFGQDVERKFTIQTRPLLLVYDIIALGMSDGSVQFFLVDLEGQYKINNSLNFSLTVSFLTFNGAVGYAFDDIEPGGVYYHGLFHIKAQPMLLYRPFKTGLQGFYMGLYPDIGLQSVKNNDETRVYTGIGLGFNIGYKWIAKNGFTMQLASGICKTWSIPEQPDPSLNSFDIFYSRWPLRNFDFVLLDFKIGYSF